MLNNRIHPVFCEDQSEFRSGVAREFHPFGVREFPQSGDNFAWRRDKKTPCCGEKQQGADSRNRKLFL